MEQANYYEILGISPDATLEDLKKAYRAKATENHPDSNIEADSKECHTKMCEINEAYSTLRNMESRKKYDESLLKQGAEEESVQQQPEKTAEPQKETVRYEEQPKYDYSFQQETFNKEYEEKYQNFNSIDFEDLQQEEFIFWLEKFYNSYMTSITNDYKFENELIKKLVIQFTSIIAIEKLLLQKRNNINSIHK